MTAEPLQNAGGDITESSDWSASSSRITRHESSDLTIDGSDQVTHVQVQGTKASGNVDVKIDLLDTTGTILDTKTVSMNSGAESFTHNAAMTLANIPYFDVAEVKAVYTSTGGVPTDLTLALTDGWDSKDTDLLSTLGTFSLVQTSDNSWLQRDGGYFMSFQFDQTVPTDATINSVKVYVEHWEDNGSKAGDLTWEIGTGTLSSLWVPVMAITCDVWM